MQVIGPTMPVEHLLKVNKEMPLREFCRFGKRSRKELDVSHGNNLVRWQVGQTFCRLESA